MDLPIIVINKPLRVRGGWVIDATVHATGQSDTVRITVTERLAATLLNLRGARIGENLDPEIAGIFDKILSTSKAILGNPAVRMAVNLIPYGSTALTVADAGFAIADAAKPSTKAAAVLRAQPAALQRSIAQHHAALALARDLRAKKPRAMQIMQALPPASRTLVDRARMYDVRTDAIRDFQQAKGGDRGALARIEKLKGIGNRNPYALTYMEALENVAIADQAPPAPIYASAAELDGETEVGARVPRPRGPRRPPRVVIAELGDLLNRRAQAAA